MARFVPVDRDTEFLFPPSVQEWLPKDHLARFVVDVVEQLDLSGLEESYAGRGSDAHHPAMLVALLLYGYATGTFSSRALERASYDSIAFRYVTANTHPDHDTIKFSQALPEADRSDLHSGAVLRAGAGDAQAGDGGPGRDQGAR